jgi:hypothetical protein
MPTFHESELAGFANAASLGMECIVMMWLEDYNAVGVRGSLPWLVGAQEVNLLIITITLASLSAS